MDREDTGTITITGHPLDHLMCDLDVPIVEVDEWAARLPRREKIKDGDKPIVPNPVEATDTEIHRRIGNSKDGPLMERLFRQDKSLWEGEGTVYGSRSQADQGLFTNLTFYCQGDREQVERIAKTAYMWREKWTRNYIKNCIDNGIANCNKTSYYDPDMMRDKRHEAIERLFHQRMNHRWESVNERDLYLAYLAIGYHRGKCDEDESREGFVLDALYSGSESHMQAH